MAWIFYFIYTHAEQTLASLKKDLFQKGNPCAMPIQSYHAWIGLLPMNSITKSSPVYNAKTGIISYALKDLVREDPPCPHCGDPMRYWYSRKRGVIISDHRYTFMAPRFKCSCGRTMTMRPYFIARRKQYGIFAIQEILNADASGDSTVSAAYGASMVAGLRKWAVALVKMIAPDAGEPGQPDGRSVIRALFRQDGSCWLASLLQKISGGRPFSMVPCPGG